MGRTPWAWAALLLAAGCITAEDAPGAPPAPPPAGSALACAAAPCAAVALAVGAEPWVAIDPSDPAHAVVAAMGPWTGAAVNHPWVRYAVTTDGGATWAEGQPPGGVNDPASPFASYDFAADVMVEFGRDGTVVLASLVGRAAPPYACVPPPAPGACPPSTGMFLNALDLAVWRSTDGGTTFEAVAIVAESEGAFVLTGPAENPFSNRAAGAYNDREVLVVDPVTGRLHLFWVRVASDGNTIQTSRSDDAGATWSVPEPVLSDGYGPYAAAYDGTVVFTAQTVAGPESVSVRSTDGGDTWGEPVVLGPVPAQYYSPAPVALWPVAGTLHGVVARVAGDDSSQILLQSTTDAGATWSAGAVVLPERATHRRIPMLAVDAATGRGVVAAYNGTPDSPDDVEMWALALDGGAPVGQPIRLSEAPTPAYAEFDYFGADVEAGTALLAWGAVVESGALATVVAPVRSAGP